MGTLAATPMVTLDGVMEAPGGEPSHPHTGWAGPYMRGDVVQWKLAETLAAERLLVGRVTYASFAEAWPAREGPFAAKMNAMPKHVVSSTLGAPAWGPTEVIAGDPAAVVAAVARLVAATAGEVLVPGSRSLLALLLAHDLVDELRLLVFPVALGSGDRALPPSAAPRTFALAEARAFDTGVVLLRYRRAAAGGIASAPAARP